jgi:hypothetical protein
MNESDMKIEMDCRDCLRKHLAAALSYAKEILDGHGKGARPDHRPDFAGEIINAEHHAIAIDGLDPEPFRSLRHGLDSREWCPDNNDIDRLRHLWTVADLEENEARKKIIAAKSGEAYDDKWLKKFSTASPRAAEIYQEYLKSKTAGGCSACKRKRLVAEMRNELQKLENQKNKELPI